MSAERDPAQALGLSESCEFILRHCGVPMDWKGSGAQWEGKPGHGFERSVTRYACPECGAESTIVVKEPC